MDDGGFYLGRAVLSSPTWWRPMAKMIVCIQRIPSNGPWLTRGFTLTWGVSTRNLDNVFIQWYLVELKKSQMKRRRTWPMCSHS